MEEPIRAIEEDARDKTRRLYHRGGKMMGKKSLGSDEPYKCHLRRKQNGNMTD